MRNWYKYLISDKLINNLDDRFLFSNYQLIDNNKNFKDIFNFKNFKQNRIFFKQYNFLKNNLDHQR